MRISDWSSDVCSSDLRDLLYALRDRWSELEASDRSAIEGRLLTGNFPWSEPRADEAVVNAHYRLNRLQWLRDNGITFRSEEHTSELQSLMRISYAVFCLKKKTNTTK